MNIIKKIVDKEIDETTHHQFTRFGKGNYKRRFLISMRKTKKVKVKSSFEFSNDLVSLCSEFGSSKVSGIVLSKNNLSELMKKNNIEGTSETKKGGLYYLHKISEQELTGEQIRELAKEAYFTLLDMDGKDFKLKMKKKLPKPGKSEKKVDDKFCQLEADFAHTQKIKKDFFWDIPEGKKISISHEVVVDKITMPEGEKDYAKIRELAIREGKIIRKATVDEKESVKEIILSA